MKYFLAYWVGLIASASIRQGWQAIVDGARPPETFDQFLPAHLTATLLVAIVWVLDKPRKERPTDEAKDREEREKQG